MRGHASQGVNRVELVRASRTKRVVCHLLEVRVAGNPAGIAFMSPGHCRRGAKFHGGRPVIAEARVVLRMRGSALCDVHLCGSKGGRRDVQEIYGGGLGFDPANLRGASGDAGVLRRLDFQHACKHRLPPPALGVARVLSDRAGVGNVGGGRSLGGVTCSPRRRSPTSVSTCRYGAPGRCFACFRGSVGTAPS